MPDHFLININEYIRGIGTDYEQGIRIPGVFTFNNGQISAKKLENSNSVNSNSVTGEPPYNKLDNTVKAVTDFYGSKDFSWIIKSGEEFVYLEEKLKSIGMRAEKTFFGMYYLLDNPGFNSDQSPEFSVIVARDREQIGDVVDLTCEIFGINVSERDTMIQERLTVLNNPENRSGFAVVYAEGKPIAYSRHRFSHDGKAMYLTGSGVIKEFRKRHVYLSLLQHRYELALKYGCRLLTVLASRDTSMPILDSLGFSTESKYLFMTRKVQV